MPSSRLVRRLRVVATRLERGIESLVADIGEEVGRDLVPATPVDTGFARANWRPSINVPAELPVTLNDPSGAATVARITTVSRQWRIGDVLYLVNNAPYIVQLNEGSSPQAQAGFVAEAVRTGTARAVARAESEGLI